MNQPGYQDSSDEHYSYRVYRDPGIAGNFDSEKFGGRIGQIFKDHQEHIVRNNLPELSGKRLLDLGAGTGRLSLPISRWGC